MLSAIFVIDGVMQARFHAGAAQYMESYGVPGGLLPLVVLLHIGGGLGVALGFMTRIAAVALAIFSLLAAIIFHSDFSVVNQFNHFLKNIGLAGGFLLLALHGPGHWSIDRRFPFLGRILQG